MTSARREQIIASLHDKEYRDAFVEEQIDTGLPFQIRAMRQQRGWTQADLGQRTGMAQETVSLLESPSYGRFTLRTLKRLASAFDVALMVRFVPFSRVADLAANLSPEDLAVPDFEHDPGFERPALIPVMQTADWMPPQQRGASGGRRFITIDTVFEFFSPTEASTGSANLTSSRETPDYPIVAAAR